MLEYFPAMEAAFDYSKKAPLILKTGYQTRMQSAGSELRGSLHGSGSAGPAARTQSRPRPWKPPVPSTRCWPPRRWASGSSPGWPSRSWQSTSTSPSWMRRSRSGSGAEHAPGICGVDHGADEYGAPDCLHGGFDRPPCLRVDEGVDGGRVLRPDHQVRRGLLTCLYPGCELLGGLLLNCG